MSGARIPSPAAGLAPAKEKAHGRLRPRHVRVAPLKREPFTYLILPGFVKTEALAAVNAHYPRIDHAGSFAVSELKYGHACMTEVDGATVMRRVEEVLAEARRAAG